MACAISLGTATVLPGWELTGIPTCTCAAQVQSAGAALLSVKGQERGASVACWVKVGLQSQAESLTPGSWSQGAEMHPRPQDT